MDVMMPEMDGLTATRLIRAAERPDTHVTIVGLTAGSDAETLADCTAAGMNAVTTKPVTAARLRGAIAEGMDAAARHEAPSPDPGIMPRISELKEELGEEAVQEILAAFIEDIGANLTTIEESAARSDARDLPLGAHHHRRRAQCRRHHPGQPRRNAGAAGRLAQSDHHRGGNPGHAGRLRCGDGRHEECDGRGGVGGVA
jgi:response regulator RpfG family c-di-GMP phosphodiesterase